jgi:hypothetical protein
VHVWNGPPSQAILRAHKKTQFCRDSLLREIGPNWEVGDEGLEPSPFSPENQHVCDQGGAKSGARIARAGISDFDLATVIAAWPALPQAIKAGIVAMVRATK